MTRKDVDLALTTLLEIIVMTVSKGETVRLVGFGSFHPKSTSKPLRESLRSKRDRPPTRMVKFSIGKFFKKKLIAYTLNFNIEKSFCNETRSNGDTRDKELTSAKM